LHFAAGLGVPTLALYGPTSAKQWAPLGARHRVLQGTVCTCPGAQGHCTSTHPCLAGVSVETVAAALQTVLAAEVTPA
jgi:ADP-heptose:LPS heptosyltransferase